MRFLVQPAVAPRSRAPVRIFLVFAALALAGLAAQRVLAGGLSPAEVELHYVGAAEDEALPAAALWEEIHQGAFVYGLVVFMLGALLALCPVSPRVRAALVGTAFVATLADLLAPLVIAAVRGGGALRVVTFVAAAGSLLTLLVTVAAGFGRGGGEGARA
jgi:hypothetical protein